MALDNSQQLLIKMITYFFLIDYAVNATAEEVLAIAPQE